MNQHEEIPAMSLTTLFPSGVVNTVFANIYCIAMAVILMLPTQGFAQTLWRGTAYGMSIEEVRAIIPEASLVTKPIALHSGAKALLAIKDVELVHNKFTALFFFLDNKLTQVTLSLDNINQYFGATMVVFDSLVDALRVKYGPELSRHREESSTMQSADATWSSGRTTIWMTSTSIGGRRDTSLSLIYQVRLATEADKL